MDAQTNRTHMPSLFTLLGSALGALILFSIALALASQGVMGLFTGADNDTVLALMMAGGLLFTGLLTLPGMYYSLRRLINHPESDQPALTFGAFDWLLLIAVWPALILAGSYILDSPLNWLLMPVISIVTAAIPIAFIVRLSINRLRPGPRQQVWGTLGLGLTVSPIVILAAELIALLVGIFGLILFLVTDSERMQGLLQLIHQLETLTEDQALSLIAPNIYQPGMLLVVFGFVAVAVPLIEELFKTLPLWFFGRQIRTPAEGFILGVVSGAAFALFENIGYAANDTETWVSTTLARIGAGSMHILTGGLMGWAWAGVFARRNYLRLAGVYLLVVFIHGLWNAMGVGLGLGILSGLTPGAPDIWLSFPLTAVITLAVMGAGGLVVLSRANRRLRADQIPDEQDTPLPTA